MPIRTGRCLCGSIHFEARIEPEIQACHCVMCQRWTGGGPLMSVRVHDLVMSGQERAASYHASQWGERGFCGTCGTTLYWRMQDKPIAFIAVGLLDDQSGLVMTEEIFVDYRPDWLPAWPDANQSTEAQEMAKLEAYQASQNS